jgi:glycosyltransferase involved in cell wall biosynthesis
MPRQADSVQWSRKSERISTLPDPVIFGLRVIDRMRYEHGLRDFLRKTHFHIYHETSFFPPAVRDIPVVFTLYDLSLIKHRDKHPRERVWFSDLYFKRRLPYVSHIITISEHIRNELIDELKIPPHKVTSIHLAPGASFYPRPKSEIVDMLDRRAWPREYILFVGTLEPRKNLPLLIKALSLMKTEVPLLLAGWSGWNDAAWWGEIRRLGLHNRVILAGHTDEETLACLYGGASAFVYPSLYEGFGLPVIEAMACGSPVICSNRSSLPEVAGDAAIMIDPGDPEALAHSLDAVLQDSVARDNLVAAGLQRAKLFSWKNTALRTLDVFGRVSEPP